MTKTPRRVVFCAPHHGHSVRTTSRRSGTIVHDRYICKISHNLEKKAAGAQAAPGRLRERTTVDPAAAAGPGMTVGHRVDAPDPPGATAEPPRARHVRHAHARTQ